jgi:hypothetical protein
MRKLQAGRTTTIGFQNGQDASQVTMKNQAKAQTVKVPVPVATSFSKIGGSVANIMEATQQTSSPTDATCTTGYKGVSYGLGNADMQANILGAAQHCAVCSDAPSSEPYNIVLPCRPFIDPISYNPNGTTVDPSKPTPGTKPQALACTTSKDMSILYTDNSELVADQGRQLLLRRQYNLPSKLQSLRGPIVNR